MKYSGHYVDGSVGSSGSCLSASYSTYATYVVQLIQNYQSNGVPITWLDVQNEPGNVGVVGGTGGNGSGNCEWSASTLDAFVKVLGPALSAAGLSTKLILGSMYNYANSPNYFGTCQADSSCNQYISIYSGHGYGFPDSPVLSGTGYATAISNGKHVWQGETSPNGDTSFCTGMSGTGTCSGAITMAQNMSSFLSQGQVSTYQWWELAYPSQYPADCPNCNLVDLNYTLTKKYFVYGNWSLFVRPGQVEIGATYQPQSGVQVTAFKNTSTGAFEIVAVNSNSDSVSQSFSLTSLSASSVTPYITDPNNNLAAQTPLPVASKAFTATLTGSSVTTFVGSSGGPEAPTNLAGTVVQ